MSYSTFTPVVPPSPGTNDKPEFKVLEAQFGNGYTQSTGDGQNNIRRVLMLSWDLLTPTDCATMVNFIKALRGATPFYYTPSDETTPVLWTCKDIDDTRADGGFRKLSMTFRQSFVPA